MPSRRTFALLSLIACLVLGALAYLSFRLALRARLDRAQTSEAASGRPAAAARLEAALALHRLSLVAEKESLAVSAAFRRADASETVEAYRRAGGDAALLEEARKALSGDEVALLRAVKGLREEARAAPLPPPPQEPSTARMAGPLLIAAGVCACLAALLSGGPASVPRVPDH